VLVPPLAVLDEARCGAAREIPGQCQGSRRCLTFHRPDGGSEELAGGAVFGPDAWLHFSAGLAQGGLAFVTATPAGVGSTLWYARPGSAPLAVQQSSEPLESVYGFAEGRQAYAFWYIAERCVGIAPQVCNRQLLLATDESSPAVAVTGTSLPRPTSNARAWGSNYFVAFPDGVHRFYPAGESLIAPLEAEGEEVRSLDVDATDLVYLQCSTTRFEHCTLYRMGTTGGPQPRVELAYFEGLGGGVLRRTSLVLLDGYVYVLGVRELVRVPKAGGPVELVYRGEEFPQYGGTLNSGSLVERQGKLYFGSVCHFDADAPGYATVELAPSAGTARWVELDPAFPFVPHVTPYQPWEREVWWHTAAGIIVAR
jgi:hypothetical protein